MIERFINSWVRITQQVRQKFAWIGYLLILGSILYLLYLLFLNWDEIPLIPWENLWGAGFISIILYLFSLIPQVTIWVSMMQFYHQTGWQDYKIFFQSMLMRRIPGGIWHWVGRITLYSSSSEIPSKVILRGNFWEWIIMILIALAMTLLGKPIYDKVGLMAYIGSALVWSLAIFIAYKWFPSSELKILRILKSIGWILIYTIAWIMGGLIIFVFGWFSGIQSLDPLSAIWIWALAGGISWLIIIVPSGFGIREITLTTLLQPHMGASYAIIVSIAIRIVFMLSDFLWGGLGWGFFSLLNRKKHANRSPD